MERLSDDRNDELLRQIRELSGFHPEESRSLSEDQIETILLKLRDVTEAGTAYHSLIGVHGMSDDWRTSHFDSAKFHSIFKMGLLGNREHYDRDTTVRFGNQTKEKWAKDAKEFRQSAVHFNIVGRSIPQEVSPPGRDWERVMQGDFPFLCSAWGFPILVIDIQHLREDVWEDIYNDSMTMRSRTFRIIAPDDQTYHPGISPYVKKEVGVCSEYGFSAANRIAPRFFRGIITNRYAEQHVICELEELIQKGNKGALIPVYNDKRDLVWPVQLEYQDIRKVLGKNLDLDEGAIV